MSETSLSASRIDVPRARSRLRFFRVMAFIVGVGLLVLVAEVVLGYLGNDALAWWPQPHGLIFVVYVAAVVGLGFAMRWPLWRMVLLILAGCVPFVSFWAEHVVTRSAGAQLDALASGRDVGSAETDG